MYINPIAPKLTVPNGTVIPLEGDDSTSGMLPMLQSFIQKTKIFSYGSYFRGDKVQDKSGLPY